MSVVLTPIRIMDAAKIKDTHLLSAVTDDVPSFIRGVLGDPHKRYFLATDEDDPEKALLGLFGLENISKQHHRADIVMILSESEENASPRLSAALDRLIRLAFFEMEIHRLSVLIRVDDLKAEKMVLDCHLVQEAVLEDVLYQDGRYHDAGLFFMLDSDYPDYSVGFVPFRKGVLAVRGDNETVESTKFYGYGTRIEETLERNIAIRTGIADTDGVLKEAGSPEYKEEMNMSFPKEVQRCMQELYEYFGKRRTVFSIHAVPLFGSEFQKRVWEKVSKIPYGVTISYEDVALELTGGDKASARNLTRAVGAACRDNPLPVLIPCHRVIGKDGRLVGFSGGLEYKEFLLNHEMFGIHIADTGERKSL